jgi:hypothetical protein
MGVIIVVGFILAAVLAGIGVVTALRSYFSFKAMWRNTDEDF